MTRMPLALLAGGALCAAVASLTVPAQAQTRYQPTNDGSAASSVTVPPGQVAPGYNPHTRNLNNGVNGNIETVKTMNAAQQAQYQQDLAGYDMQLRQHGRRAMRQDAHYQHERRAYADAMEAWRVQVAACKRGHSVACKAPPPDPADFY